MHACHLGQLIGSATKRGDWSYPTKFKGVFGWDWVRFANIELPSFLKRTKETCTFYMHFSRSYCFLFLEEILEETNILLSNVHSKMWRWDTFYGIVHIFLSLHLPVQNSGKKWWYILGDKNFSKIETWH